MNAHKYQVIHFCILYGDSRHMLRLFESYSRQNFDFKTYRVALVVINNNESGHAPPEYKFPEGVDYSVINAAKNLGYYGAAQMALEKFSGNASWTIVSNSDLEFASDHFFSTLKNFSVPPDLGVLAPRITSELSGRDQNPYMANRPSGRKMQFLKYMFSSDLSSLIYQSLSAGKQSFRRKKHNKTQARAQQIYAPHGSFILFHQNYFVRGLDFTHPPFLFGEEITVAENLKAARLIAYFEPSLEIRHQEHQATGRIPDKRMRGFIKAASHYIADRYF